MSYFADIIKQEIRNILQHNGDMEQAQKTLERLPQKVEEAEQKITKAVQAAVVMGEEHEVAQQMYNTYPDVDVTQYGLPEPEVKALEPIQADETTQEPEEEDTTGLAEES